MRGMTQVDTLKEHFRARGNISPMEAMMLYGINSLSRRICDIKEQGWTLHAAWRRAPNGKRYKRYYLESEGDA